MRGKANDNKPRPSISFEPETGLVDTYTEAREKAIEDAQRTVNEAVRTLVANSLRIITGTGMPELLTAQAAELLYAEEELVKIGGTALVPKAIVDALFDPGEFSSPSMLTKAAEQTEQGLHYNVQEAVLCEAAAQLSRNLHREQRAKAALHKAVKEWFDIIKPPPIVGRPVKLKNFLCRRDLSAKETAAAVATSEQALPERKAAGGGKPAVKFKKFLRKPRKERTP